MKLDDVEDSLYYVTKMAPGINFERDTQERKPLLNSIADLLNFIFDRNVYRDYPKIEFKDKPFNILLAEIKERAATLELLNFDSDEVNKGMRSFSENILILANYLSSLNDQTQHSSLSLSRQFQRAIGNLTEFFEKKLGTFPETSVDLEEVKTWTKRIEQAEQAKNLWVEARKFLHPDNLNVTQYLHKVYELKNFIDNGFGGLEEQKKFSLLKKKVEGSEKKFNPEEGKWLELIFTTSNAYSRAAAHSKLESAAASSTTKLNAFFMDAALEENEGIKSVKESPIDRIQNKIYVAQSIMQYQIDQLEKESDKTDEFTLLQRKISSLEFMKNTLKDPEYALQINIKIGVESLEKIFAASDMRKLENDFQHKFISKSTLGQSLHYKPATIENNRGRFHLFKAKITDEKMEKYKNLQGDALKTAILIDFKIDLEKAASKEDVETLKTRFKTSPEYKILQKGQGLVTNMFKQFKKTSSVKAVEKLIEEAEKKFSDHQTKP